LGVAAGAFGAHVLEGRLSAELLETYEKAVRYQLVHAVAQVLTGLLAARVPGAAIQVAGGAFLTGIILFSGCLYGWIFTQYRPLVHLVPLGGTAMIVGWIALALAGLSLRR
jgi:uncharacterized membrane protein YgdD (TMEM256/DUF423 family)